MQVQHTALSQAQALTLADLGARFMAALTMMRVDRISCSNRGRIPGRASGGAYAMPLGAMMSLARQARHPKKDHSKAAKAPICFVKQALEQCLRLRGYLMTKSLRCNVIASVRASNTLLVQTHLPECSHWMPEPHLSGALLSVMMPFCWPYVWAPSRMGAFPASACEGRPRQVL